MVFDETDKWTLERSWWGRWTVTFKSRGQRVILMPWAKKRMHMLGTALMRFGYDPVNEPRARREIAEYAVEAANASASPILQIVMLEQSPDDVLKSMVHRLEKAGAERR